MRESCFFVPKRGGTGFSRSMGHGCRNDKNLSFGLFFFCLFFIQAYYGVLYMVYVCGVKGQSSEQICSIPISSLTKCQLERSPNDQKEKKLTVSGSNMLQSVFFFPDRLILLEIITCWCVQMFHGQGKQWSLVNSNQRSRLKLADPRCSRKNMTEYDRYYLLGENGPFQPVRSCSVRHYHLMNGAGGQITSVLHNFGLLHFLMLTQMAWRY